MNILLKSESVLATLLKSLHLLLLDSDKETSDEDQAVWQLSPDSNTSPQPKRTRGGNTSARRRGKGYHTCDRSSRFENLTTNDATSVSPSLSLPPSPSLSPQAVSSPSDEANNDNDAADVIVHNQASLPPLRIIIFIKY